MTGAVPTTLEELIRHAGEDGRYSFRVPKETAVPHMQAVLRQTNQRLQERSPDSHGEISEKTILMQYHRSPHKILAFLQALGETDSPDMLVMAWRILEGVEIAHLQLTYVRQDAFHLRVELRSHTPEIYESDDINDAAILRHLGVMKIKDKPVYDGFFALNR